MKQAALKGKERLYFPHINLLRGFAAISVFVYHLIEHYDWHIFPKDYGLVWFRIGWMAVDLFFVISGFVIAWSLIHLQQKHAELRPLATEFLWRRAGRIVPLYVVTMLAFAICVNPGLFSFHALPNWLAHLTFLYPFHSHTFGSINGVNWSIGIEVHFYLFALITCRWWIRLNPIVLMIAGIFTAWTMRYAAFMVANKAGYVSGQIFPVTVQMPMMLDEFSIGMAVALLVWRYPPHSWPGTKMLQGIILGGLAYLAIATSLQFYWTDSEFWSNPIMVVFWRSSIGLAFGVLLLFFIWLPALKKPPLLYRSLYYLGDISYGIYLWHVIVLTLCYPFLYSRPDLYLLVTTPIVLLLAAASWHWLEKPAIKWAKKRSNSLN